MRLRNLAVAAAAISCTLISGDASAQNRPIAPAQVFSDAEIHEAIDRVRADPNLGGIRTIRTLHWRRAEPGPRRQAPAWLSWIVDLVRFLAQSGRVLLWVAIGAAVVALASYLAHVLSSRRSIGAMGRVVLTPTHVRDLDIRPESLPADIGAAARRLWTRGERRAALALLYRGLLSRLAHVHRLPIRASTTEGGCVALAALHLDVLRSAYVVRLVNVWQRAVYGGSEPDDSTLYSLCDAFDRTLEGASRPNDSVPAAQPSA